MNESPLRRRVVWRVGLIAAAGVWGSVFAAGFATAAAPTKVFHVRDYGAVADGKTDSGPAIRAAIAKAVASGPGAEVLLEAGTYRAAPEGRKGACFPIHNAADLTLRGAGSETKVVIAVPSAGGFSVTLGRNVVVRDMTIDYDPVPFCQGTVRAVDPAAGHFDLEIAPGYPTPDAENFMKAAEPYGKWGMIVDRTTRRIRAGTPDHYMTPRWQHRDGRVWRFFTPGEHYRRSLAHMRPGDAYVHLARGYGSTLLAQFCDGVRFENLRIHASPGLAVGLVGNRGAIVVRGLEVRFAPDTDRLLSTNADGVHCQQNRAGPIVEKCYFEGMADDAVNIYAPPNVLREIRAPSEWLVSPGCIVRPGDRLQVLDPKTGRLRGEVKAAGVAVDGRGFLLSLERPLPDVVAGDDHRNADTLYNLDACGAGFQIRNNHVNGNRRYGVLLRAGGGVIEGNTFADMTGAGVVLTNEPDWPEGPMPWSVTVRGNRFLRGGTCLGYADSAEGAALVVRACRLGHGLADAMPIRDVTIEDNTFVDCLGAAIFAGGAAGVAVRGNRVEAAAGATLLRPAGALAFQRSRGIVVSGNQVADRRAGVPAAVSILPDVAPGEAGIRVSDLKTSLPPGAPAVLDQRRP